MQAKSQRSKGEDGATSSLNIAIETLDIAREDSSITPAKAVFGSVSTLLKTIRDTMISKLDYVELGLACADVCRALDRGMSGRQPDGLSRPVCEAIEQLTTTVVEIQRKFVEKKGQNLLSRLVRAKHDKETIAAWNLDLIRILQIFNVELALGAYTVTSDMHQNMLKGHEDTSERQILGAQTRALGESPQPPPRIFFGRDGLIEKIVDLAESLTPVALIGTGGVGKTSIALTVLHHGRIKQRFGDNRRFIRCDKFPATPTHFLGRISKVIGTGIKNPEDLTSLFPFLSSKEMLVFLDNAESILDPRGTNAREMYVIVKELSRLETMCLCITSRISTVPPDCETLDIPTLSAEAAHHTFYQIYKYDREQSDSVDNILKQLDFHPLSITLLATVAHHSKWGVDRLTREWESRRIGVLQTEHNESLAATIELSLASPMFQGLGPDARALLGVVAFFPQGVNEANIDWLFPTLSGGARVFDKFCMLSLTHQSGGFITMLAPLRDYLRPKDPQSSPLLCTINKCYFSRLSVAVDPDMPGFEEARWITSEDVNVEHLLNIFTSIDAESDDTWDTCAYFMEHLFWHKKRLVVLGPKIKGLPDDHPSKPQCMVQLSWLFGSVGNYMEQKRLLAYALRLQRVWGDDRKVAQTLRFLSEANRLLGLYQEGIQYAREALGISEQLGDAAEQARCLNYLAWLLHGDKQLDAAQEIASRVIDLPLKKGNKFPVCQCHRLLGLIHRSKSEKETGIDYFEAALGIARSFGWHDELFWIHFCLAELFHDQDRFDDAHAHVGSAKSYAVSNTYFLGRVVELQAGFWYRQRRFDEAGAEALHAVDLFEKLGATRDAEYTRELLRWINGEMNEARVTK